MKRSVLKKIIKEVYQELNEASKMNKEDAYKEAIKAGVNFKDNNSDQQDSSAMNALADLAKKTGYKKPKNANGSLGRYFYYHLLKLKKQNNWK